MREAIKTRDLRVGDVIDLDPLELELYSPIHHFHIDGTERWGGQCVVRNLHEVAAHSDFPVGLIAANGFFPLVGEASDTWWVIRRANPKLDEDTIARITASLADACTAYTRVSDLPYLRHKGYLRGVLESAGWHGDWDDVNALVLAAIDNFALTVENLLATLAHQR